MQKPQQRKYHSSCNRSVHRGTAHGKQEVKVCKRKTPHLLMRSFLSPYGGWYRSGMNGLETRTCFRPLTGMVQPQTYTKPGAICFRPLTGMVLMLNLMKKSAPVFAPLRGWYGKSKPNTGRDVVFAPLWGWYRMTRRCTRLLTVFAPLRGWYTLRYWPVSIIWVFAPLWGWYTKYITEDRKMEELNA